MLLAFVWVQYRRLHVWLIHSWVLILVSVHSLSPLTGLPCTVCCYIPIMRQYSPSTAFQYLSPNASCYTLTPKRPCFVPLSVAGKCSFPLRGDSLTLYVILFRVLYTSCLAPTYRYLLHLSSNRSHLRESWELNKMLLMIIAEGFYLSLDPLHTCSAYGSSMHDHHNKSGHNSDCFLLRILICGYSRHLDLLPWPVAPEIDPKILMTRDWVVAY